MLNNITNKVSPITQILFPEYELLFMFDNAKRHSIHVKNVLQVVHINKKLGVQQLILCPG